ncbi:MAG: DNA primase noncatalytic subunit PriX, partial [Candidatus Nitrosocosmicus sp.]|nr:DNA primase noncatalytic subunit PriX [Candidatus Nitrosocosmicus sp.]
SKAEALKYYEDSGYRDCRINAFPPYVEYKGMQRYPPDFIFIDLDRTNFNHKNELESALSKTLSKISEILKGSKSTVLWTGNGYHVYQPLESVVLEQYEIFAKFQDPSKQFLRFAKHHLSSGKADPFSNPSFKSCLLRTPYSINSKCLSQFITTTTSQNNETNYSNEFCVKIIQEWNGFRPSIKYLLRNFLHYLINQKIKERNNMTKNVARNKRTYLICFDYKEGNSNWIENLLHAPINDYRKHTLSLILSPYLINVKKVSYVESCSLLTDWLSKCDTLRKLDFNPNYLIKLSLNNAISKRIPPMRLNTLKNKNIDLYHDITNRKT